MEWNDIVNHIREVRNYFDKSYKSLIQNRIIQTTTINKQPNVLVECLNKARQLIYDNKEKLNSKRWS